MLRSTNRSFRCSFLLQGGAYSTPGPRGGSPRSSHSSGSSSELDDEEIAEVEMLLEAYFMHIDNTWNRLQTLNEYIEDTEVRPGWILHASIAFFMGS